MRRRFLILRVGFWDEVYSLTVVFGRGEEQARRRFWRAWGYLMRYDVDHDTGYKLPGTSPPFRS